MQRSKLKSKGFRKRRKPTAKQSLQKEADKLWAQYAKARDNHLCQWCGKIGKQLHAHHIYSRACKPLRHDPENSLSLCGGCHLKAHSYPEKFRDFLLDRMGEKRFDALKLAANTRRGYDPAMSVIVLTELLKEH